MINKIYRRIKCNLRCFGEWLFAAKMARWGIKKYAEHCNDEYYNKDFMEFCVNAIHDYIQEMFDSGFIKLTIGFITWHEDAIKEAMDYRDSLKAMG